MMRNYLPTIRESTHSQGKLSGFDKEACKSSKLINLLKLKTLVEVGKLSLYVTNGMGIVLGVIGNDETILGSQKARVN